MMKGPQNSNDLLITAALNSDVDLARKALALGADINYKSEPSGLTALMIAAMFNDLEMVEYLLGNGADVLLTSKEGKRAMDYGIEAHETYNLEVPCPNKKIQKILKSRNFDEANNEKIKARLVGATVDANPNLAYNYQGILPEDLAKEYAHYITGGDYNLLL